MQSLAERLQKSRAQEDSCLTYLNDLICATLGWGDERQCLRVVEGWRSIGKTQKRRPENFSWSEWLRGVQQKLDPVERKVHPKEWTVPQVSRWLNSNSLSSLVGAFSEKQVSPRCTCVSVIASSHHDRSMEQDYSNWRRRDPRAKLHDHRYHR